MEHCSYATIMVFLLQHPWIIKKITEPLGRKSNPTICYNNELLPEDWLPRTTTFGNDNNLSRPMSLNKSTNEMTLRKSWRSTLPYIEFFDFWFGFIYW